MSEFDEAVALSIQPNQAQAAKVGFSVAADTNPDVHAEMKRIAQRTGVPVDTVYAMPEDIKKQARMGEINFDTLATTAPATAALLSNVDKAKIAHDDVENLHEVEYTLNDLGRFTKGTGKAILSGLLFKSAEGLYGLAQAGYEMLPFGIGDTFAKKSSEVRKAASWASNEFMPKAEGVAERSWYSGMQSLGLMGSLIPLGLASGGSSVPVVLGMGASTGGSSYGEARDSGKSVGQSLVYGGTQGAIESGTEMIGMPALFSLLKPGKTLTKVVEYMVKEQGGEQIATHLQDLNTWATLHPEKTFRDYLDERPNAALETALATAFGGGGQVVLMKGVGIIANRNSMRVDGANATYDTIRKINEMSSASKVLKRDAETFESLISSVADNGNAPMSVFINANTLQQSGIAEKLAEISPSVSEQYETALQTGGLVQIPIEEYTARIAPTEFSKELVDHVKFDPDEYSKAEADEYMQNEAPELQAEIERVITEQSGDDAWQQSAKEVEEAVFNSLQTAGHSTEDVNRTDAILHKAFSAVMAQKLGMTPMEFFNEHTLRVISERLDSNRLYLQTRKKVAPTPNNSAKPGVPESGMQERPAVRAVSGSLEEPAQSNDGAGSGLNITAFDAFVKQYAETRPVDTFTYDRELSDLVQEIEDDWSNGNSDNYSYQFGPDQIRAGLRAEDESAYYDEDGDLTDAGSDRYNQLERALAEQIAKNHLGEPKRKLVYLNKPKDMAEVLHDFLEQSGVDVWPVSGSGKSGSQYFEVRVNGEKRKVRVSDHALPTEYADDGQGADYEVALYDTGDGVRNDGRMESEGINENEAIRRAEAFIESIAPKETAQNISKPAEDEKPTIKTEATPAGNDDLRNRYQWVATSDTENGPLFAGNDFVFDPIKSIPTEDGDFVDGGMAEHGLMGHAAHAIHGATTVEFSIMDKNGIKIGELVADVLHGDIVAIHDFEVYNKSKGYGSKIVAHIVANTYAPVRVVEALEQSKDFWKKVGADEYDQFENGQIDWEGSRRYLTGKQGKDQSGRDGAQAKPSSSGNDGFDVKELSPEEIADLEAQGFKFYQSAYHGSPYRFDKFSLEHMGKGEGAQAYGWGLYFAGSKEVAEWYRDMLSSKRAVLSIDGKPYEGRRHELSDVDSLIADAWHSVGVGPKSKKMVVAELKSRAKGAFKEWKPRFKQAIEKAQSDAVSVDTPKGQLYKVDVPGDETMLHWDKPLNEQPEKVLAALGNIIDLLNEDRGTAKSKHPDLSFSGSGVYGWISEARGGDEAASKYLNSIGISGIKYLDGTSRNQDVEQIEAKVRLAEKRVAMAEKSGNAGQLAAWQGKLKDAKAELAGVKYNYVIFDDSAVNVLDTYYQNNGGNRGSFNPTTNTIALLKGADLSTFLHESGHFFLEVQADLANQLQQKPDLTAGEKQVLDDTNALLKWFGINSLSEWNNLGFEEKRSYHEQFARGFEAYLFEGKAPSIELHGVFQRFRAWLLNVYKSLTALDVELTDEVRVVFDRMLATTEQIQLAEQARSILPLFESAEQAGWDANKFAEYQMLGIDSTNAAIEDLQARGMRDLQWSRNARGRVIKKLQSQFKERRAEIKAEVRREVMSQPIYQAWQFLTSKEVEGGEPVGKLSRAALVEMYSGEGDRYALLDWKRLTDQRMTEEEGWHPDMVAEKFGFTSGDELVRKLLTAEKPSVEIEAVTEARMLARYGELSSPEAIEKAADAAIHNEVRAKMVATEANALAKATGGKKLLVPAAKEFASSTIAKLKIRALRPSQYANAEARAGKAAAKASRSGDVAMAAVEKRNQVIQTYAAKAAYDAIDEVDKGLRYLKKFDGGIKRLDPEYSEQIDNLLGRFDLRKGQSNRSIDKRVALADWIKTQRDAGFEPDIPKELENEAFRTSYKNLTVEEFRGLIDTVRQIEHLGRLKHKLLTAVKNRNYEAVRDEIASSVRENSQGREANTRTPTEFSGRVAQKLKRFWASHIKAAMLSRVIDGNKDGGAVWEYIVRSANQRGDMETTMRSEATAKLSEILEPVLKLGKMGGRGKFFESINRSLNREARIVIALNMGNEGNVQRLLGGEGWTIQQIAPVLQSLNPQEWKAVQDVWDHFESYRTKIGEKERRVYGKEPEWVDPRPFTVTASDGSMIQMRGGYYPIKFDPIASQRAEEQADAEGAKRQLQGAYTTATTRRSFTKTRAEEVNGRPLLYTLSGLYSGVNDVIHDLAWHEWLIDVNRLLKSDAIDSAIREHYGAEVKNQFKTWVQDIAEGDKGANSGLDIFSSWMRRNVSLAGLGFNVISAAMQPVGITQSIVRVGTRWVARGVCRYISDPVGLTKEVNKKSSFMENRARTRFRELAELRNRVEDQTTFKEFVGRYGYWLMMRFQQMVDVPTWQGAYEKAISEGNDESRSIALADQAVIDSQGGGMTKDLSEIERGGPTQKLFTVFYSFMNTALNIGVAQTMGADTPAKKMKLASDYMMLYVAPAMLVYFLKNAIIPGDSGDDDKLPAKLAAAQLDYLMGLMVGVREFAEAIKMVSGANDFGRPYSGPAGMRIIPDSVNMATQIHQGEFDAPMFKSMMNVSSDIFGLPSAQINRTITGTKALIEGETDNPASVMFGFQKKH